MLSSNNGFGPTRTIHRGHPPHPPSVEGYEILERIGRGGMGEVYVARQVALGRLVALKFLVPDWDDPECDSARFRREAELMAKVCHPNVLSLFDYGEAGGRQYLAMEYVEGGDLRRRLTPGEPLSVDEVRSILRPVADALDFLHRQGIIHRDLKPENILLHDGCTPLVTDFGIATLLGAASPSAAVSLTKSGRGVGTLGYVAPEQQYRLKVDERADQYSLAAMAYEMLTGQLPLGVFKAPSLLNPRLASEVDTVILRALQENPKDRFANVKDFADALDVALSRPPRAPLGQAFDFLLSGQEGRHARGRTRPLDLHPGLDAARTAPLRSTAFRSPPPVSTTWAGRFHRRHGTGCGIGPLTLPWDRSLVRGWIGPM